MDKTAADDQLSQSQEFISSQELTESKLQTEDSDKDYDDIEMGDYDVTDSEPASGGFEAQLRMEPQQTMSNDLRRRGNQLSEQSPNNEAAAATAAVQNKDPINIVLLGKTGVGKSSTGNTILGENRFKCGRSLSSVTNESSDECKEIDGRNVRVIDTPGFFDTTLSKEKMAMEFARSVYLSRPGVNAFLFVVPYSRFTKQEAEILNQVKTVFGGDVLKHVIILFTYGDECDHETVDSEIDKNQVVKKVIQSCHGYHILNNRDLNNRRQVTELMQKILNVIAKTAAKVNSSGADTVQNSCPGGYYTNEMYELAQKNGFEKFWHYLKQFFFAVINFFTGIITNFTDSISPAMYKPL